MLSDSPAPSLQKNQIVIADNRFKIPLLNQSPNPKIIWTFSKHIPHQNTTRWLNDSKQAFEALQHPCTSPIKRVLDDIWYTLTS